MAERGVYDWASGKLDTFDGVALGAALFDATYGPNFTDSTVGSITGEIAVDDYVRAEFDGAWDPAITRLDIAEDDQWPTVGDTTGASIRWAVVFVNDGSADQGKLIAWHGFDEYEGAPGDSLELLAGIADAVDGTEFEDRLDAVEEAVALGAAGVTRFDQLQDVSATGDDAPADGDVPTWELTKWVPKPPTGGGALPPDGEVGQALVNTGSGTGDWGILDAANVETNLVGYDPQPLDEFLTGMVEAVTGEPALRDAAIEAAVDEHVAAVDPHGDRAYAAALFASNDALVFKGSIDCSSNPNYPAADAGHTYRVSVAGKIGGASGPNVEAGDLLLCTVDGSAAGTAAAVGANWTIGQTNIDGAVIGPAGTTDGYFAVFDGTSGRLIKALTPAQVRTALSLVIGTDVQAFHANLGVFAGLTLVADRLPYANGSGTLSLATFTSFARQILDDPDAATVRATIGAASVINGGMETAATNAAATGAVTVDLANGNLHALTLTGAVTLTLAGATNAFACSLTLELTQDATGSRAVTWPASVKWPGGTPPTLSTTAGAVDVVTMYTRNGGTTWRAGLMGKAFA